MELRMVFFSCCFLGFSGIICGEKDYPTSATKKCRGRAAVSIQASSHIPPASLCPCSTPTHSRNIILGHGTPRSEYVTIATLFVILVHQFRFGPYEIIFSSANMSS
jgi:hypothetical protein